MSRPAADWDISAKGRPLASGDEQTSAHPCVDEPIQASAQESKPRPVRRSGSRVVPGLMLLLAYGFAYCAMQMLDEFSTIELEIASTIFYFMSSEGMNHSNATEATKRLKPSKSQPGIIKRADDALSKVGLYERGRAN